MIFHIMYDDVCQCTMIFHIMYNDLCTVYNDISYNVQ